MALKKPARRFLPAIAATAVFFGLALPYRPAFPATDLKAGRYYEDALTRYEKNDVRGAILQLKNALQIDKTILPAQVLLGKALLANGEAAAAEVAFLEAIRLGVNRAEVILPMAQAMIAQGKQGKMLEQLSPDGLPNETRYALLLSRAAASADLGNSPAALSALEEARRLQPANPSSWTEEVPIRIRTKQFREASLASGKALELAPNNPEALYQKGVLQHIQGDRAGALASYDKVLSVSPNHLEARVSRAGLRFDAGLISEARQDAEKLRIQTPGEPRGAYLLALIAEQQGDHAVAKKSLNEVTALIDPAPIEFIRYRPQLLMMNGLAHYGLGEQSKAKSYLESFQRVQPGTPVAKLLAQIRLAENAPASAVVLLEDYLKLQPGDSQAKIFLASVYVSQGLHHKASQLMQEALQHQDVPTYRTALGISLLKSGDATTGIKELETAFRKDPSQSQAGVTLALSYLKRGDHAKATNIAQGLLRQDSRNPAFLNLLGLAREAAKDLKGAREAFEKALASDQNSLPSQLNIARLDTIAGSLDAAEKRLLALHKTEEKNPDVLLVLAQVAKARGRDEETRQWLEKAALNEGSRETRAGLVLVSFHLQGRRPTEAVAVAKNLLLKTPEDLPVLLAYIRAQLAANNLQAARNSLTDAARYAGYSVPAQTEIASLQLAAGNLSGAQYSAEKALSSNPDHFSALLLMTEIELRQGDLGKAERRAKGIIDKHPKRGAGHMLLADVLRARNQLASALEADRLALRIEPGTIPLLRVFNGMWQQKDHLAAQKLAEDWLRQHPKDLAVRRSLANGYARLGKLAEARKAYEILLNNAPQDTDALNNLANILLQQKDPSALTVAEKAHQTSPSDPNTIDTLGWVLSEQGQNDRALTLLRDARLRAPNNPEIRYHLAVVLAKVGRTSEAREEVDAALKISDRFEQADSARKLAQQLRQATASAIK